MKTRRLRWTMRVLMVFDGAWVAEFDEEGSWLESANWEMGWWWCKGAARVLCSREMKGCGR